MANPLAAPSFITGPLDSLATADVYKVAAKAVVNSIQAISNAPAVAEASGIRGGKSMSAANLAAAVPALPAAPSVASLTARLNNAVPSIASALNSLSSGSSSSLLGSIKTGLSIVATVNGVAKQLKNNNLITDALAIGNLIGGNKCGHTFNLSDPGAAIGALSGLINQGMALGIPNAFTGLTCGVTNPNTLNGIAANVMPSAITQSDYITLGAMGAVTTPGALTALKPNVLNQFTAGYQSQPGTNAAQVTANYNGIQSAFNSVNPGWNKATINGGSVPALNVTSLIGASSSFNATLACGARRSNDPAQQLMLVAQAFSPMSVGSQLSKAFPTTFISSAQQNTPPTGDPAGLYGDSAAETARNNVNNQTIVASGDSAAEEARNTAYEQQLTNSQTPDESNSETARLQAGETNAKYNDPTYGDSAAENARNANAESTASYNAAANGDSSAETARLASANQTVANAVDPDQNPNETANLTKADAASAVNQTPDQTSAETARLMASVPNQSAAETARMTTAADAAKAVAAVPATPTAPATSTSTTGIAGTSGTPITPADSASGTGNATPSIPAAPGGQTSSTA